MREILFKAKRVSDGKWIEGYYAKGEDEYIVSFGERGIRWEKVDPATVGQFTGLTDKNGTKIFEGDIVEGLDYDEENGFGVVYWDDGAFFVGNSSWCGTFCENYNGISFEVIGNIHDNPELLKGGEDNG